MIQLYYVIIIQEMGKTGFCLSNIAAAVEIQYLLQMKNKEQKKMDFFLSIYLTVCCIYICFWRFWWNTRVLEWISIFGYSSFYCKEQIQWLNSASERDQREFRSYFHSKVAAVFVCKKYWCNQRSVWWRNAFQTTTSYNDIYSAIFI